MNLTDLQALVKLGLHYDNLTVLISELESQSADHHRNALGCYVIGSVLKELMGSMNRQAVRSGALLVIQAELIPHIEASLAALEDSTRDVAWTALTGLVGTWKRLNMSDSELL